MGKRKVTYYFANGEDIRPGAVSPCNLILFWPKGVTGVL
jgi:hypothetical protein